MEPKEAVKNLPRQPGIYLMKNLYGMVIYVGKAKNLKARVSQYFQKSKNHSSKIIEMIQQIHDFDYITVDTELEAFLLECKTIKEMRPPYNKLLKNYKNYKYIRIPVHKKYPIPEMVTETREDGALYFGPFTSQSSVENAVVFLKNHYGIRKCNSKTVKKSTSGCLNLHLGTCSGPCTGTDVSAPYMLEVNKIVQLLQGKDQEALRNLKSKMLMAAERLEFEKAAAYREQLKGIRHVLYKQKVIKISGYGRNVIAAEKYGESTAKLFFIKGNRLLKKEELTLSDWDCNALENKLKILARDSFKIPKGSTEKTLSQEEIDEAHIIYSYLKKSNNGIISANIPISRIETLNYSRIAGLIINSRAQDISKGDFENNTGEK
ncbi:MAG: hypothetical protein K0R50_2230 [Eubacterium sp.]|nr:hypothetical protein [Eubacterium sp.]